MRTLLPYLRRRQDPGIFPGSAHQQVLLECMVYAIDANGVVRVKIPPFNNKEDTNAEFLHPRPPGEPDEVDEMLRLGIRWGVSGH